MSAELIAVLAIGVGLTGLILTGQRGTREELRAVRGELRALGAGVATLDTRVASVCQKIDIYLNSKNKWRFEVTKIFHIR